MYIKLGITIYTALSYCYSYESSCLVNQRAKKHNDFEIPVAPSSVTLKYSQSGPKFAKKASQLISAVLVLWNALNDSGNFYTRGVSARFCLLISPVFVLPSTLPIKNRFQISLKPMFEILSLMRSYFNRSF